MPLDPATKVPKGLAYVTYADPSNAVLAFQNLDKKSFQGRLLHILPAVDRKGNVSVEQGSGKPRTLKEEKEAKKKAMAGKEFNWGMLYMNVCSSKSRNIFLGPGSRIPGRAMLSCPRSQTA